MKARAGAERWAVEFDRAVRYEDGEMYDLATTIARRFGNPIAARRYANGIIRRKLADGTWATDFGHARVTHERLVAGRWVEFEEDEELITR